MRGFSLAEGDHRSSGGRVAQTAGFPSLYLVPAVSSADRTPTALPPVVIQLDAGTNLRAYLDHFEAMRTAPPLPVIPVQSEEVQAKRRTRLLRSRLDRSL
ncbi:MAG: hypothetical protein ACLGRW_18085 [Acidobacteriota bacterium]|jgi:hypothetical protein